MILELVFEQHSEDAETQGSNVRGSRLTEQQVSKLLIQCCVALLPIMGYYSRKLSNYFLDLKCNFAASGICTQSMDLVGNEF